MPFAKELTFSVASRYSDYGTFGDTTNSKFGFNWRPIDELLVRGTWAEGFRAPTIADLYGGISQSFEFYTDPCDTRLGAALPATPACLQPACRPTTASWPGPGALHHGPGARRRSRSSPAPTRT